MSPFGKRKAPDPDDERVRAYLSEGQSGPRTDWLAAAAVVRIAATPVAARERYGEAVGVRELAPATELVRELMIQDRDLSAWIARKSVVQLKAVIGGAMSGDFARDFAEAFAAMGVEFPNGQGEARFIGDGGARFSDLERDAAQAFAD